MVANVYITLFQCETFARNRGAIRRHAKKLKLFPPREPLESVKLDILGPFTQTSSGDLLLRLWPTDFRSFVASKKCVLKPQKIWLGLFFEEWVFTYGPPETFSLFEKGLKLTAKMFQETCHLWPLHTSRLSSMLGFGMVYNSDLLYSCPSSVLS